MELQPVKQAAQYRWVEILSELAGLDDKQLSVKEGKVGTPCPICGGKDRYSFKKELHGDWACRGCKRGGDGFELLKQVNNWTLPETIKQVGGYLGLSPVVSIDVEAFNQRKQEAEERARREAKETRQKRVKAKLKAQAKWARIGSFAGNAYSEYKRFSQALQSILKQHGKCISVPVYDAAGDLIGLQDIPAIKDDKGRWVKTFPKHSTVKGGFLQWGQESLYILIGEGVATVDAGYQLAGSNRLAVCAFMASQLPAVAAIARSRYPDSQIVILADQGKAGEKYAIQTVQQVENCQAVLPPTGDDWSDYFLAGGQLSPLEVEPMNKECEVMPFPCPVESEVIQTEKEQARKPRRRNRLGIMRNIEDSIKAPDWLVRNWFEADSMGCIIAPSYTGKSFLALDLACSVATGTPWQGNDVKRGAVAYIAGEGNNGIKRRLRAWEIKKQVTLNSGKLICSDSAYSLGKPGGSIELIEDLNEVLGEERLRLIIVDTVARNTAGREENNATDTGLFIAAMDEIKKKYGCTILLVHHTGHGNQERGRGSSALYAAQDCEYLMRKDEKGVVELKCTKMKDGIEPPPMNFEIVSVELGIQDDIGEQVTSAVLVKTEKEIEIKQPRKKGLGKNKEAVLQAIRSRTASGEPHTYQVVRDDLKSQMGDIPKFSVWVHELVEDNYLKKDGNNLIIIDRSSKASVSSFDDI